MIVTRLAKAFMVAAVAAFALLVAWDNVVDYGTNYAFVQHVMSMDTIFPDSALKSRAITDESVWRVVYALIIAAEFATGFLLAAGALALLMALRAPAARFNRAKALTIVGATVGFGVWFFGFMVVAGNWFAMWQSHEWNAQQAAFRFYITLLAVLIFVTQRDDDLA